MKTLHLKICQLVKAMIFFMVIATPSLCSAYVECAVVPIGIYTDNGTLWVNFSNGGAGVALISDPATKYYNATMSTALIVGRSVAVRYADGTSCTGFNVAMIGLWLK